VYIRDRHEREHTLKRKEGLERKNISFYLSQTSVNIQQGTGKRERTNFFLKKGLL
jgi:hypothetical protein